MYKQPPIWILNSTLLVLFIATILFVIFTQKPLPSRKLFTQGTVQTPVLKDVSKIDISRIYKNDLFNTSREILEETPQQQEKRLQLPPPPKPISAPVIETPPVYFLEPLAVTLKGIMFSTQEQFNRVVLEENKSKKEKLYKVGDSIEDAEIIRIYPHKVILVRSNGQQETLFATPAEAQQDPSYKHEFMWSAIIKKLGDSSYSINRNAFAENITHLAQFIDALDITSAFKRGQHVGCRVGVLKPQSLGAYLGLQTNDIITHIMDIPTTTTNDRVAIYGKIKELSIGESFTVRIMRQDTEIVMTYMLVEKQEQAAEKENNDAHSEIIAQEEQLKNHEISNTLVAQAQRYTNPMLERAHKHDVYAMNNYANKSLLHHVST